jgi:RNA polymerase sigma-70 factor (ECF subfamily)
MSATSLSLLERLKRRPSDADWKRFQEVYMPLIRGWLSRVPGIREETDDLTQEVLLVMFREINAFDRQREGSFRAWLRQITINRVRTYCRERAKRPLVGLDESATEEFLGRLEDSSSDLASQWDKEHDRHVFDRLLAIVQPDFQPQTWNAFRRFAIDGVPAAEVATELGMTVNSVLLAKSRILQRLRDEAGVLLE